MSEPETSLNRSGVHAIDSMLRGLLVCPLDQAELQEIERALRCTVCGRVYAIVDGVPDMEVRPVD